MADDEEWSKNPLDYTLFGGLAAMFGSNDDEDSDSSASALGEGDLSGGIYDNGLPGDEMCRDCGHADIAVGGDCDVCGGAGTGVSKTG
jgi:hypothetical protein